MRYFIVQTPIGMGLMSPDRLAKVADNRYAEFVADMAKHGGKIKKEVKAPSIRTLEKQSDDGIVKCPDGCRVEPDGTCPHGFDSWLIVLGLI